MACRIADGVTRRAMDEGTPVVAFLVARNMRYPYKDNPNQAPIAPCDVFAFESLPIYGTFDGYGGVKVSGDESAAVHLARKQVGGLSWDALMSCGVGDSYQLLGKPGEENKRAYGIFMVHQDVFERVCAAAVARAGKGLTLAEQRDQDVGLVLKLVNRFLEVCQDAPKEYSEERGQQIYHGLQIAGLRTSVGYADDGTELDMPELARIFGSRDIFGDDIQETLRELKLLSSIGSREPKAGNTDEVPHYKGMLESLWMTHEFYRALDLLDVTVVPAKRTRSDSFDTKLMMAANDIETLVQARLNWAVQGYGDIEDLPSLEANVKVVRDVTDRLEHELQSVRTELTQEYVERCARRDK
jgi:hypothetical protein